MRFSISMPRCAVVPLGLTLCACAGESTTEPSREPPTPAAIALVSGDGQEGKAGEALPEPFVVRVTDAQARGVGDVRVTWRVASGAGELGGHELGRLPPHEPTSTVSLDTDPDGFSRVFFRPTALGTSGVVAEVAGLQGSPVSFSSEAGTLVVFLVPALDGGCGFEELIRLHGPERSSDVVVPVGTPVEWDVSCDARIASFREPSGGEPFDSGDLERDERFRFVPGVAGTWEYADQVSGVTGTLTAR